MAISDGYIIERRAVLWLGATALATFAERGRARAAPPPSPGVISWEELTASGARLESLAAARDAPGVDAYLHTLAALAVRVAGVPDRKLFPFAPRAPDVSFAPLHRGRPFVVIAWRMLPGARLPPHNHPGYSVCTLGLEGEARLRHYQPPPDAPPFSSREPFRVRLTHDLLLGPRTVSTLAPGRDNIHTFTAGPKGARGIDIGTLHAGADTGFSFLDIDERSEKDRSYVARWDGR